MSPFDQRTFVRAAGVLLGLAVYYAFDWEFFQHLWRFMFSAGLSAIGHDVHAIGIEDLRGFAVDGRAFGLSRNCTYVDLMLVLAPLFWRPARSVAANAGRLGTMVAALALFNFLRVTFAIHMNVSEGLDWEIVHFWPDFIFHFAIIVGAALRAVWVDWREIGPDKMAIASVPQQA